jgi:hypothetical protein
MFKRLKIILLALTEPEYCLPVPYLKAGRQAALSYDDGEREALARVRRNVNGLIDKADRHGAVARELDSE